MAINKFKPHLHIIPEDDANRQIANGFLMHPEVNQRQIRILPPAGGWHKTKDSEDIDKLEEFPERFVILLIDFDGNFDQRIKKIKEDIGEEPLKRTFIFGAKKEPEDLKRTLNKNYEEIGFLLAEDCLKNKKETWSASDLSHNTLEIERGCVSLREIIFA